MIRRERQALLVLARAEAEVLLACIREVVPRAIARRDSISYGPEAHNIGEWVRTATELSEELEKFIAGQPSSSDIISASASAFASSLFCIIRSEMLIRS